MAKMQQPLLPSGFDLASLQGMDNDSDVETAYESFRTDQGVPTFTQENESDVTLAQESSSWHQSQSNGIVHMQPQTDYNLTASIDKEGIGFSDSLSDVMREAENMVGTQLQSVNFVQPAQNMNRPPLAERNFLNPVTPTKSSDMNADPLTPTANLKVLISAASPEIRNRDNKKKELFKQDDTMFSQNLDPWAGSDSLSSDYLAEDGDDERNSMQGGLSRKEKSLGLLCQRFLSKFPEYPGQSEIIEISLDSVAKSLGVERRRIYDIVNVLESVEVVSRQAKNKYLWHGKTNLQHTLGRLKTLAKLEGYADKIEKMKEFEMSRDVDSGDEFEFPSTHSSKRAAKEDISIHNQENLDAYAQAHLRKDRSLGIMSQKFLMLFLVSKPKMLNLDLSAKILIGDPNIDRTNGSKFKTKIRRLYDIANILTSLNLIKKVHVTEVRGRKPAFMYIGPDLDNLNDVTACSANGSENHRPSTKHSMLDCVMNPIVCGLTRVAKKPAPLCPKHTLINQANVQAMKPAVVTNSIEDKGRVEAIKQGERDTKSAGRRSFTRHSSFELICKAAEKERSKLYSNTLSPGMLSRSQGNIPMTLKSLLDRREPLGEANVQNFENIVPNVEAISQKILAYQSEQQPMAKKRIVIIKGDKKVHIMQEKISSGPAVHKVTLTPVGQPLTKGQDPKPREKIIIKALPDEKGSGSVSISKEQLTAVLQAVNQTSAAQAEPTGRKSQKPVQCEASSEQVASEVGVRRSKRTVQQHHLTGDFHYEMPGKKMKVDQQEEAGDNRCVQQPAQDAQQLSQQTLSQCSQENGCTSSQDSEVARITQRSVERTRRESKGRPSPLRALHLQAEFRSSPPLSHLPVPQTLSPDVVTKVSNRDLELASPLPIEEQSYCRGNGTEVGKENAQIGKRDSNDSCSIIHSAASQIFMQTQQQSDYSVFKFPIQASSATSQHQSMVSPGFVQVTKAPSFFPYSLPLSYSSSQWYRPPMQFMPGGFNPGPLHVIPPAEILSPPALSPFSCSPSPNSSSTVFTFGNPPDYRTPEAGEKRPVSSSSSSMSQTSPLGDLSSLTPSISQVPLVNISPKNKSSHTSEREGNSFSNFEHASGMSTPQHASVSYYKTPQCSYLRTPGFVTPDSSQNIQQHTATDSITTARQLQLINSNNIC